MGGFFGGREEARVGPELESGFVEGGVDIVEDGGKRIVCCVKEHCVGLDFEGVCFAIRVV